MGVFIRIEVKTSRLAPEVADQLVTRCPVDIFALEDGQLCVQSEREDECTLCELCLDAAPAGSLIIRKTYKDERLISRGL
jgi:NAD-dependent dihydropyrimidine dehydrogenase PreA subunit